MKKETPRETPGCIGYKLATGPAISRTTGKMDPRRETPTKRGEEGKERNQEKTPKGGRPWGVREKVEEGSEGGTHSRGGLGVGDPPLKGKSDRGGGGLEAGNNGS